MNVQPKFKNDSFTACGETVTISHSPWADLPENSIYDRLIKLCASKNSNLKAVCKETGVCYTTILQYKRGVKPNEVILHKFLKFFDLAIDYLFKYDLQKIGDRLRYNRVINGYTIKELARIIGVRKDTISDWESGKRTPKKDNLEKSEHIFGHNTLR